MTQLVPDYVLASKRLARFIGVDDKEVVAIAAGIRSPEISGDELTLTIAHLKSRALELAIERLPAGYTAAMMASSIRTVGATMRKHYAGVLPDEVVSESYGRLEAFGLAKKKA